MAHKEIRNLKHKKSQEKSEYREESQRVAAVPRRDFSNELCLELCRQWIGPDNANGTFVSCHMSWSMYNISSRLCLCLLYPAADHVTLISSEY